ncbi:hypothetical protein K2173_018870 [Erythroxylum novogranatense]|uniref:Lipase n=1 Tax=Erythroxylum novogranatense TaxID=1862640 RepID=A0AAV8SB27_9ROSI|nr:hypothetical protein K2173_018870 [Erythroxylum novogranatense]
MKDYCLTLLYALLIFWGLADGIRAELFTPKIHSGKVGQEDSHGICKSMIEAYVCEEHLVTTQDGYVLSLQHIPVGISGVKSGAGPPVLLQHGLLMDGTTWLLLPREKSLALLLADNGFDVWIISNRGTKYSRGHTSLSPDESAYWNWSWDELAAYDLPATFQYVHNQTGQKLHYVGHSQGTLIALAAISRNQLLSMLRSAVLLTPIAYLGHLTSTFGRAYAETFLAEDSYWLGLNEFVPRGTSVAKFVGLVCKVPGVDCTNILTVLTGPNCCLDSVIIDAFLQHELQPTSTKNMVHLSQMIRDGTITMYNYNNEDDNWEQYGQATPLVYNMTNIPRDLPLFMCYGGKDALSVVKDVLSLLDSLKDHDKDKIETKYLVNYGHMDFVMGGNAKRDIYNPILAFFRRH